MFQPRITLLLILAVFGSICQQAPAISTKQYEIGTTYNYDYTASVLLNEPPPLFSQNSTKPKGTDVGYQVSASLEITAVWQDPSNPTHLLLELLVTSPKLSIRSRKAQQPDGFINHVSPLDDMPNSASFYFDWNDGRITKTYAFESESPSLVNFKKGIASLFQIQNVKGEVKETDSSGTCDATYRNIAERTLVKNKRNCVLEKPTSAFVRPQKILGVSTVSSHQTKLNLSNDLNIIDTLTSTEVHSLRMNLRSQVGASVISRQYLKLKSETKSSKTVVASSLTETIKSIKLSNNLQLVEDDLQVVEVSSTCTAQSCEGLKETLNNLRKALQSDKLATTESANAFTTLLPVVRRSPKADIVAVLKNTKNKSILPQLLDVVAAAQTPESFSAVVEVLNFQSLQENDILLAERFLQVLSLATHPSEHILNGLLSLSQKIKSNKLKETALLALGAATYTFCSNSAENNQNQLVTEIQNFFVKGLEACRNEECTRMHMRVFRNLRSKDISPILIKYIDSKDKKTSVGAVKALRALFAFSPIDDQVKDKLQRVFFQIGRRYDSSARTLALDTLLEHEPDTDFLLEVLTSISQWGPSCTEVKTYTLQRLQESAGNDPTIQAKLKQILSNRLSLNNYHVFAQNGLSTAFSRELYRSVSGNGSFSSSTEAVSGMMKRSSFDVFLRNQDTFQLLSFGLFTAGLGSLMGSSNPDDEPEEEDATAGMEITLSGVQLRPVVFFTGQGELMGHVWSGTASERTSALQATVLLQDHRHLIPLQSGFVAVLNMYGSVSFDFGGEIQISIWNKNSHSIVDERAALDIEGSLDIVTPFVKSNVAFTVSAEARIDFTTDVNFGDGLLACLRMGQGKFNIDYTIQKRESIPGTKHWIHKRKKKQEVIPGRTFALNDKNSALCSEMFRSNDF